MCVFTVYKLSLMSWLPFFTSLVYKRLISGRIFAHRVVIYSCMLLLETVAWRGCQARIARVMALHFQLASYDLLHLLMASLASAGWNQARHEGGIAVIP